MKGGGTLNYGFLVPWPLAPSSRGMGVNEGLRNMAPRDAVATGRVKSRRAQRRRPSSGAFSLCSSWG